MQLSKKIWLFVLCGLCFLGEKSQAASSVQSEIQALKNEIGHLLKRIDELEKRDELAQQKLGNLEAKQAKAEEETSVLSSKTDDSKKDVVTSGNDKLSLKISGQVNRMVQLVRDGDRKRGKHVDNNASASRINMTARGELNDNFSVEAIYEVGIRPNSSTNVAMGRTNASSGVNEEAEHRKVDLVFTDKRYGTLSMGKGNMAAFDAPNHCDLSNTFAVVNGTEVEATAAGYYFYDSATRMASPHRIKQVINGLIGERTSRIRYDTPQLGGLTLSVSHAGRSNDTYDFAARFVGKLNDVKMAASASFINAKTHSVDTPARGNQGTTYKDFTGAVGVLFPVGLNLFLAKGRRFYDSNDVADAHMYLAKLGWIANFFEFGTTSFAVEYGRFVDMKPALKANNEKYDVRTYGAYLVQKIEQIATELYCGIKHHELCVNDRTVDLKALTALIWGARVKF